MFHVGVSYEDGNQGDVYGPAVTLKIDTLNGNMTVTLENGNTEVIATDHAWMAGWSKGDREVATIVVHS